MMRYVEDRLSTKHQVLILSTFQEYSGHERTYVELLVEFFNNDFDIVERLGGFLKMQSPTEIEYGTYIRFLLEENKISLQHIMGMSFISKTALAAGLDKIL